MKPRRGRSWIWFFLVLVLLGGTGLTIEIWYNLSQQLTPAQLANVREAWQQNGPRDYDFTYRVTRQGRAQADVLVTFHSGRPSAVRVDAPDWSPARAPLYDLGPALAVGPPTDGEGTARGPFVEEGGTHEYTVRVRDGRAVEVRWNEYRERVRDGRAMEVLWERKLLTGIDPEAYSMEGLFAALGRQLELDSGPGRPRVFAVGTFGKGDRRLLRYVRSCRALRERVEIKFVDLTPFPTPRE